MCRGVPVCVPVGNKTQCLFLMRVYCGAWGMSEPREIRILNHSEMTTAMFIKGAS